jgi:hypothetical protein
VGGLQQGFQINLSPCSENTKREPWGTSQDKYRSGSEDPFDSGSFKIRKREEDGRENSFWLQSETRGARLLGHKRNRDLL